MKRSIIFFAALMILLSACQNPSGRSSGTATPSGPKADTPQTPEQGQTQARLSEKNFWLSSAGDPACPFCTAAADSGRSETAKELPSYLVPLEYFRMPDNMKGQVVRTEEEEGQVFWIYRPHLDDMVYYTESTSNNDIAGKVNSIEYRLPGAWYTFWDSDGNGLIDNVSDEDEDLYERSTVHTVFLRKGTVLRTSPEGERLLVLERGSRAEEIPELSTEQALAVLFDGTLGYTSADSTQEVEAELKKLLTAAGATLNVEEFQEYLGDFGYQQWIDKEGFKSFLMYETRYYDPSPPARLILFFYNGRLAAVLGHDPIETDMFAKETEVTEYSVSYRKGLDEGTKELFEKTYSPILEVAD